MRILLVEDDLSLGDTISAWLEIEDHVVDWVKDGVQAESALATHEYACVLLDRGLPKTSGDQILSLIRHRYANTAVIMITARDSIQDRVQGLDLGADDYLVKPFDLEELSARIRAVVRKYTQYKVLEYQGVSLNPTAKLVKLQGEVVHLTSREYVVLYRLMRYPQHVVSKEQLEDELYGWGEEVESNAIEVYIYNLRKKLGSSFIKTLRRQGYTLGD